MNLPLIDAFISYGLVHARAFVFFLEHGAYLAFFRASLQMFGPTYAQIEQERRRSQRNEEAITDALEAVKFAEALEAKAESIPTEEQ